LVSQKGQNGGEGQEFGCGWWDMSTTAVDKFGKIATATAARCCCLEAKKNTQKITISQGAFRGGHTIECMWLYASNNVPNC